MKSENLNFLEPSGPLQACNGTALSFNTKRLIFITEVESVYCAVRIVSLYSTDKFRLWNDPVAWRESQGRQGAASQSRPSPAMAKSTKIIVFGSAERVSATLTEVFRDFPQL